MGRRSGRKITRRLKAERNKAGLREVMAHPEQIHRVMAEREPDGSRVLRVQLFADIESMRGDR